MCLQFTSGDGVGTEKKTVQDGNGDTTCGGGEGWGQGQQGWDGDSAAGAEWSHPSSFLVETQQNETKFWI